MKNDKLRLAVMVLLLCLATAGAALAVRPWGAAGRNAALQYAALYPQAA